MITEQMIATSWVEPQKAMLIKLDASVSERANESGSCLCLCSDCVTVLPVFGGGSNDFENDETMLLFRKSGPAAVGNMVLYKDGEQVDILDGTAGLGTYYPLGTWSPQTNYYGYRLDWDTVAATFGYGDYHVIANQTFLGQDADKRSDTYRLMPYSRQRADGTTRFTGVQSGYIERNNWDFTGMDLEFQLRLPGIFWQPQPEFITDNYLDSDRTIKQVQDQIAVKWTFESEFLTRETWWFLIDVFLLCNTITVVDYNTCNPDSYQQLGGLRAFRQVVLDSFQESKDLQKRPNRMLSLLFAERTQNRIKRNFR
jgi:hypothetical protein